MSSCFSDRIKNMTGNAIRDIFKLLDNPEVISFAGGMPASQSFDTEFLNSLAQKAIQDNGVKLFQYGATEGYAPLFESVGQFLGARGINASRQNTLIISGGQQGIDLTAKAFLNKGDRVLVEAPTYLAALQIFNTYEAELIQVDCDRDGMILSDLEEKIIRHKPKLIYLVPTFQNPTGKSMPLENRKRVAALVEKYNVVLIEDDPYRELRYRGEALPPIKSLDESGNVVYLSSFSKIISPGLRVGAAIAEPELLRKLTIGKQATDVHTSTLSQAIVDGFLRSGRLPESIAKANALYAEKKNLMQALLAEKFPKDVRYTDPDGGLFIWAELPGGVNVKDVLDRSIKRNVAFIPGEHFYADGSGQNTMRLNFSNSEKEQIVRGMTVLGECIAETIR